ncbi:hypothetical protein T4D_11860 [Trichinella pseudospiralis]|uniref:Uncharacterized protein n=1 Tax=Trichinella pseudospiralis TaxID=6337 RepID=A0A0V1G005_TRIPS|nr:hypothetical protein T4D_11860 [Trichinella pseudospiralis]
MRLFLNRRSVRSSITQTQSVQSKKLWKALTNQIDQNEIFSRPALLGTAVLLASVSSKQTKAFCLAPGTFVSALDFDKVSKVSGVSANRQYRLIGEKKKENLDAQH